MKVMYWNCTSPSSDSSTVYTRKMAVIKSVVTKNAPDILCLDEVSAKISSLQAAQDFADLYLNTAPSTNFLAAGLVVSNGVHLNQVVFTNKSLSGYTAKVDQGIPSIAWDSDNTKRDLNRVTITKGGSDGYSVPIWFIHANASRAGGDFATNLVTKVLLDKGWVFMGDFNTSCVDTANSGKIPAKMIVSKPIISKFDFSQFKNTFGQGIKIDPSGTNTYVPNPNGFIDFAISCSVGTLVSAIDSISASDAGQCAIYCDHFPILYNVDIVPR